MSVVRLPGRASPRNEPRSHWRGAFGHQVRGALAHLDDPGYLQAHPLVPVARRRDPDGGPGGGRSLRRALLDAIEALRPGPDTAAGSGARRGHDILALRYVEGLEVPVILARLAIGKSLYYVEHARALAALVALLEERWRPVVADPGADDLPVLGAPAPSGPVPIPLTRLIGREAELASVRRLLARERLLTLTGPPGAGKTRLALAAAAALADDFPHGVRVLWLAHLRDPALVLKSVARAVGVEEGGRGDVVEVLAAALADRRVLLVLDNFEHLLDAAPGVARLLERCPGPKVLVTSRARLGLRGEREFVVPPLAQPGPDGPQTADALASYPAVVLFAERARAARPDFALSDEVAPIVAAICRRLDGLPLAIELAAARARTLAPVELLARLERRLPLLTGGARDLPERQQTLRRAVDWSHELIPERDRRVFRRLAVFVGGCTLDAAERVCAAGRPDGEVVDGLAALVDNSLLGRASGVGGESRFSMLETIREYARERLGASGEADAVRRRHAAHFLGLAEEGAGQLKGSGQATWLDRLEGEHGNLRAALAWLAERAETEEALRMVGALRPFWYLRGYLGEGREWCGRALALPGAATRGSLRAGALLTDGVLAYSQGDDAAAGTRLAEALAIAREVADAGATAWTLIFLGQLARQEGQPPLTAELEESLAIGRRSGDRSVIASSLLGLGLGAARRGDYRTARVLLEEDLAVSREAGLRANEGAVLCSLGVIACRLGEYETARSLLAEALPIRVAVGHRRGVPWTLEAFAGLALALGRAGRAARLLGAAAVLRGAIGANQPDDDVAQARAALGEERFARCWEEGRAMGSEQAVAYALSEEDAGS